MMIGIAVAMYLLRDVKPPQPWGPEIRGIGAALFGTGGILINAWGFMSLRRAGTTFDPLKPGKASVLVVRGAFRYSRNPMYVGFAMALCAWACALASAWAWLGPVLFVVLITWFQIRAEERALAAKFGDSFVAYMASVRRWL
jgi:protein-S-isoprenylcysteine O-methyltransferase Ste14